jgi:hypothetical protein
VQWRRLFDPCVYFFVITVGDSVLCIFTVSYPIIGKLIFRYLCLCSAM